MIDVQADRGRETAGVKDSILNEAVAVGVVLVGILLFLALVSGQAADANLVGRLGTVVSNGITFAVGKYVAYFIPLLVLLTGILVWKGQGVYRGELRIVGLYGAVASICALLAIPYAQVDFNTADGFYSGGALGNFLVHSQCLNLAAYLGAVGVYLLFISLLVICVSIATDIRLRPTCAAITLWLKNRGWIIVFHKLQSGLSRLTAAMDKKEPDADPSGATSENLSPLAALGRSTRLAASHATVVAPPAPASTSQALQATVGQAAAPVAEPTAAVGVTAPIKPAGIVPVAARPDGDDLVAMAESAEVVQEELSLLKPYETPHYTILNAPPSVVNAMTNEEVAEICDRLEKTLGEFNISAEVVQVTQGPTVTRYEIQPAPGVKVAKIASLENDIAMCMKAESVRIIAPVPGKGTVGLEIPNKKAKPVFLREMLETDAFRNHQSPLAFALGMSISGEPYIADLATMPHVLIAGRTGSGKSVCLNSIICSILFRMPPEKVKFLMVDPKRVELNVYQAIPHLLAPVVCEPRKAAAALTWAVEQMDERYRKLASLGVRNIDGYNAIAQSEKPHPKAMGRQLDYMPHIVIVIDELADLMLIARNEVEDNIIRLAQMSRAVGMHLILATQRPSVNVITGIIKANFPSRVAFQVSSKVDSRTILDAMGAEALLGRGDMLFSPGGSPKPIRLQGCYLSDQEVESTADWVRSQAKVQYHMQDFLTKKEQEELQARERAGFGGGDMLSMDGVDADESSVPMPDDADDYDFSYQQQRRDGRSVADVMAGRAAPSARVSGSDEGDVIDEELFTQAARLILIHRKASVSLLQRKLKIGFARAGRVMDMLEERGVVGPNVGSKVRDILVDPDEYLAEMEEGDDDGDDVRF